MQRTDWEALQVGDRAKQDRALHDMLAQHVMDLGRALAQDTLNALAWMVADSVLEFRFAIPRDFCLGGDYHDKVGLFVDEAEDMVAIHGSFNDSAKGSLNGEAFSVFKSWEAGQRPYVDQHRSRLLKLWQSGNAQFQVLPLPDAIRQEIILLRTAERPWTYSNGKGKSTRNRPPEETGESIINLRPYQKEAIDSWKRMNFRGIFEMATGTGKTFTALAAAVERRKALKRVAVLILVPYLHLLEQWRHNCEQFGFFPILCSGNHDQWPTQVRSKIQDYRLSVLPSVCIIAVHQTAATERFASAVQGLPQGNTILIADEVHSLGAPRLRDALLSHAGMRLGLSATPHRWYDQEGTEALLQYFNGICFEFPLDKAIGTFLTPYRYFPIPTQLTAEEMDGVSQSRSDAASSYMLAEGRVTPYKANIRWVTHLYPAHLMSA